MGTGKAHDDWLARADAGDSNAQVVVGWAYCIGKEVPLNKELGVKYLKAAAERGSARARWRLAYIAEVDGNKDCIEMFKSLAEEGYSPALCELGNVYWDGLLVEQDKQKTMVYWTRASIAGHNLAKAKVLSLSLVRPFSDHLTGWQKNMIVVRKVLHVVRMIPGLVFKTFEDENIGRV